MNTQPMHKRIDYYLSSTDSITQFWDAANIAKHALLQVDSLSKKVNSINMGSEFYIIVKGDAESELLPFTKLEIWLKNKYQYTFVDYLCTRTFKIKCVDFTDAAKLETYLQTH